MSMRNSNHIKILDFLRGLAALSVVLFHYSNSTIPSIKPNPLADIFFYGKYGVQVFFVISGFIIPYSMYHAGYTYGNYFISIWKRIVRIIPAAYVTILLFISVCYASFLMQGRYIDGVTWQGWNTQQLMANLTFTVDYTKTEWIIVPFWTLAIEFQFYLLIGLLLPLIVNSLSSGKKNVLTPLMVTIWCAFYLPLQSFFTSGILIFLFKEKLILNAEFYLLLTGSLFVAYIQRGFVETAFATIACLAILFIHFQSKLTDYFGKISYSLYITHTLFAVVFESLIKRLLPLPQSAIAKFLMLGLYTTLAILAAFVFFKLFEEPSIKLSKKIKYVSLSKK